MSASPKTFPLPLPLLALDFVGTLLLGFGLLELFGDTSMLPEAFRFEGYGGVMVGVGALLMLPFVLHVIRTAQELGAQRRRG